MAFKRVFVTLKLVKVILWAQSERLEELGCYTTFTDENKWD